MKFYSADLPYHPDAISYFNTLAALPYAVWLDSAGMARYDILTAAPHCTIRVDETWQGVNPFALLREALGHSVNAIEGVPFAGGALGYWGYDLVRHWVNFPDDAQASESLPQMCVGIYDWALLVDHTERRTRLVSHQRYAETPHLLAQLLHDFQQEVTPAEENFQITGEIASNFTASSYQAAFNTIQAYLQAGDCYQINLAQRFSAKATGNALPAYHALRRLSPAPYSAFLSFPELQILCASPERFLQVHNRQVETKPIKGTRPRAADAVRDFQLSEELAQHPKDRAENLMIVDLLRNDLGKNCVAGSVRVPQLFGVESYANVHHLVSTVTGELMAGRDALDLLRDCFPGGSITGAPKQRAIQIIAELEPHSRGVYCGAIGYLGFDGNMDSNIVIRTLVYHQGEIRAWAGGGIVADSNCADEYQETLDKASAMLALLKKYQRVA